MRLVRILGVNLAVLLGLLALIELFFQLNDRYEWIPQPPPPPTGEYALSPEEARTKYGVDVRDVPETYRIRLDQSLYAYRRDEINQNLKNELGEALWTKASSPRNFTVDLRLLPPHENISVYTADYRLDTNGIRVVENQGRKGNPRSFVLALGDSFTFGEGVSSGKDYPSQLAAKLSDDWQVYNFGRPGAGPNDVLAYLQKNGGPPAPVRQEKGVAVWYFIADHIQRSFCNLKCYQGPHYRFIQKKPEYRLHDGRLTNDGPFNAPGKMFWRVLQLLGQSATLQFWGADFPSLQSEEAVRTFTAIFTGIRAELEKELYVRKFYVVMGRPVRGKPLYTAALQQAGFEVLDITEIPFELNDRLYLPVDGHPTSEYYWILSEVLKKRLQKDFPEGVAL